MMKSESPAARALTPDTVPSTRENSGILPEQATKISNSSPQNCGDGSAFVVVLIALISFM